jgi:hypothetical protein
MKTAKRSSLNRIEITVFIFVLILYVIGIVASWINKKWFEEVYVVEDGFIEWFTVLPLVITSVVAVTYLVKLSVKRNWMFSIVVLAIALFCFFSAGEEISWGQRIFHIKTPEYFEEHNTQDELNIHNLIVDGERINTLVFSQLFIAAAGLYLVGLPILYTKNQKFKNFIDRAGIPVARLSQIIACALVFVLPSLSPSEKRSELLEFGACFMFMLIVLYPQNKEVFRKKGLIEIRT